MGAISIPGAAVAGFLVGLSAMQTNEDACVAFSFSGSYMFAIISKNVINNSEEGAGQTV
jgi:branched-subunit amino acid ABC-type transport system permease component